MGGENVSRRQTRRNFISSPTSFFPFPLLKWTPPTPFGLFHFSSLASSEQPFTSSLPFVTTEYYRVP